MDTPLEVTIVSDRIAVLEVVLRSFLLRFALLCNQVLTILGVVNRTDVEEKRGKEARNGCVQSEEPAFALLT